MVVSSDMHASLAKVDLLRSLDPAALDYLLSGSYTRTYRSGECLYFAHDWGRTAFIVLEGLVALRSAARGKTELTEDASIGKFGIVGNEGVFGNGKRLHTATSMTDVFALEVPEPTLRKAFELKDERAAVLENYKREHRRHTVLWHLRKSNLMEGLADSELEALAEKFSPRTFHRGEAVYGEGQLSDKFYLIIEGNITISRRVEQMDHVRAYLSGGDFFGDLELLGAKSKADAPRREAGALAMSTAELLELDAAEFLKPYQRHPNLGKNMRRLVNVLVHVDPSVLQEGDRLGVAQSLLMIDLDTCVRCGNCSWSCHQTHGESRLVRRGKTISARLGGRTSESPVLLPTSCHHCTDAECMAGCPTGAIKRELAGGVYISTSQCIGCGDCSKRCPWGNIGMYELPSEGNPARTAKTSLDGGDAGGLIQLGKPRQKAVKCDNCMNYSVSACIHNCPTGAIRRGDPATYLAGAAELLKRAPSVVKRAEGVSSFGWPVLAIVYSLCIFGALLYGVLHPFELRGNSAFGHACGEASLLLMAGTGVYAARKRLIRTVMKLNPRKFEAAGVSGQVGLVKDHAPWTLDLKRWLPMHIWGGVGTLLLMELHAGMIPHAVLTTALLASVWLVVLTGILGVVLYKYLPPLLTQIESTPRLLEDLGHEQLQIQSERIEILRHASKEQRDLVHTIEQGIRGFGWISTILRYRLTDSALYRMIGDLHRDQILALHPKERQAVERVVEGICQQRHLEVQKRLHGVLRGWLMPHILLCVVMVLLLIFHLMQVFIY